MSKVRGQPQPARRGAAIVLLALPVPQGTLLLRTEPRLDVALRSSTVHLVVVSAISACALAVAVAAAVAAGRSRDGSRALRHLEADRDSHFDPTWLDAFLALMAERGHRAGPGPSDPDVVSAAADACHDEPVAAARSVPAP